ncbi:uncharacterized protein LOC129093447 isoform X2 [Anoplopoma fimbria]|uniref:uncharacterized protein LOC129093447 isoform X2 n=1 Tax=Anoplopoma fimbria TaxID=229290 RepID=UPI0023EBCA8F|nr:uncharacterized protein LOC129093447 isoform X2 [Anoplopoma fimbria]
MKLLLLLLASFCAHSSWSVSSTGTPAVTQTPDVSVVEGETVNITCCWTLEYERIRVCWLKNLIEMNAQIFFSKNAIQGSLLKETFNCSHLTLTNVTSEDSGRYICNVAVDIPALLRVEGNGTVVTVTARDIIEENTEGGSSSLLSTVVIPLAVVAPLLLIALVCFCCLRRREAQAARVIYEVPHIDSEEVEMDKHSTSSSRGSSQWCQVPVYESCDYFERVETKESG